MGEYDGKARPLSWPLLNPLVLTRTTEEDPTEPGSSFVWPEDSDERVPVIFNLSLNEFVVLASTIDVGSDVAYGIDAIRVWWLWDRVLRSPMQFCALMINCILNDEDTRDALRDFIIEMIETDDTIQQAIVDLVVYSPDLEELLRYITSQDALSPYTLVSNMLKVDECGLGYLYNQSVTAVDLLNTLSQNTFSNILTGITPLEYAQLFTTIFPLAMNAFTASFAIAAASALVGAIKSAYDAAYTGDFITEIYCGVFCLVKDDCTLSINELVDFYSERGNFGISSDPFQAFSDVLYMIQNGSVVGEKVVYLVHLLMLTAIRLNTNILGINYGQYALTLTAAGDTEDNGYETDCEDCPAPPGAWFVFTENPFSGGEPCGIITEQDETTITAVAQLGSDGKYRISLANVNGCQTFSSGGFTGAEPTGDCGCGGWVGNLSIFAPVNIEDRFYAVADDPFTMEGTFGPS